MDVKERDGRRGIELRKAGRNKSTWELPQNVAK